MTSPFIMETNTGIVNAAQKGPPFYYCNRRCQFHGQQLYFLYVKGTSAGPHCFFEKFFP